MPFIVIFDLLHRITNVDMPILCDDVKRACT